MPNIPAVWIVILTTDQGPAYRDLIGIETEEAANKWVGSTLPTLKGVWASTLPQGCTDSYKPSKDEAFYLTSAITTARVVLIPRDGESS